MLDTAVGSIKQLHDVKVQCDLEGLAYDEYLSRLAKAASEYDSGIVRAAVAESVQSVTGLSRSDKTHAATDPRGLVDKSSDEQDNQNMEGVNDNVIAIGNRAICDCAEYDPILPLYQLGYQSLPLVKLRGIHYTHGFLGMISAAMSAPSGAMEQLLQPWHVRSLNGESALMSQLPCLSGITCSVICGPPRHKESIDALLDHGESSTEPSIEIIPLTNLTRIQESIFLRRPTRRAQLHDFYDAS